MTVSIKLEDAKKEKVNRFLASILLDEGIKVTMQEAVGLMIDYAIENRDEFVSRLKELPALEDDPAWKALNSPRRWGVEDASRRVDEFVYGS